MNFKSFLKNYFPLTVRLILVKALLFFVIYKLVLSLNLKAINYPLTSNVGEYTTRLLNVLTNSSDFSVSREFVNGNEVESSQVYFKNRKVVYIADGCNGLRALMRYIGLIFCFPSRFWRKVLYVVLGLLIIHILNVFRCAGLAYVNLYHQKYFDLAHNYWFQWAIYFVILIMWIRYLRKIPFQYNLFYKKSNMA